MEYSLSLALVLGLLSTFHCLGMCGGIVGALSYGVAPEMRANPRQMLLFLTAYNGGRIISYALAGALISFAAGWLGDHGSLRLLLQVAAALLIILIGMHLGSWFPRLARIERLGLPVWRRIEPLAHALHPVRRPATAFLYGALWGWLPCGLVYSVLLSTLAFEQWWQGALYMLVFGLGTLPAMGATGMLVGRLQWFMRNESLRRMAAIGVILMGLLSLWYAIEPF